MAQANRRSTPEQPAGTVDPDRLREHIAGLLLEATSFVSPVRVEETACGWLTRAEPGGAPGEEMLLVADALGMAMDLALFTPSASGATAFDRLARRRNGMGAEETAALEALRCAQFRLLRVDAIADGAVQLRDLVTDERLQVLDATMGDAAVGVALVGRLAALGDGRHVFASGVTPLDDAGLAVIAGFVRPGARGLLQPARCAEAVYRHVLRHGTLEIPCLNRPPEGEDDDLEEPGELDLLALQWAEPDAVHDPEDVQFICSESDLGSILDVLASAANTPRPPTRVSTGWARCRTPTRRSPRCSWRRCTAAPPPGPARWGWIRWLRRWRPPSPRASSRRACGACSTTSGAGSGRRALLRAGGTPSWTG